MATQNVTTRNKQVDDPERFRIDTDGGRFRVAKSGAGLSKTVLVELAGDAVDHIVVRDINKNQTSYTVGLNTLGECMLRRNGEELQPWQVLKAALEPLLFE
ncbi:MAG: hypothetical protein HYU37_09445 [Acidobacteria bacterium]|nr:hypothetical protein [Acidobacteriota bacterium]